jgi:hypothetical protein
VVEREPVAFHVPDVQSLVLRRGGVRFEVTAFVLFFFSILG